MAPIRYWQADQKIKHFILFCALSKYGISGENNQNNGSTVFWEGTAGAFLGSVSGDDAG